MENYSLGTCTTIIPLDSQEKIQENSSLETVTTSESRKFWENPETANVIIQLVLGKLFPTRESLISDIPAGDRKTAKPYFYSVLANTSGPLAWNRI
jgi:hypothetical protein